MEKQALAIALAFCFNGVSSATIIIVIFDRILRNFYMAARILLTVLASIPLSLTTGAQTVNNGNFSSGTTGWACSAETNAESVYGGAGSNAVAEVDALAGLC